MATSSYLHTPSATRSAIDCATASASCVAVSKWRCWGSGPSGSRAAASFLVTPYRRPSSLSSSRSGLLRMSRYAASRSEEHTSELQSRPHLVCRLLLVKKNPISRVPGFAPHVLPSPMSPDRHPQHRRPHEELFTSLLDDGATRIAPTMVTGRFLPPSSA